MHIRPSPSLAILSAALVLAACSSTKLDQPATVAPVETRSPVAAPAPAPTPATPSGTEQSRVATVDLAAGGAAALAAPAQRVVYFDFDSFVVKDDFRSMIEGHARVLSANANQRLVIEGHTDERGSREYNLALGQKRAEAVLRSLTLLGARDAQLEAVSFGEERPAASGSNESAWAQNRRAELRDR